MNVNMNVFPTLSQEDYLITGKKLEVFKFLWLPWDSFMLISPLNLSLDDSNSQTYTWKNEKFANIWTQTKKRVHLEEIMTLHQTILQRTVIFKGVKDLLINPPPLGLKVLIGSYAGIYELCFDIYHGTPFRLGNQPRILQPITYLNVKLTPKACKYTQDS